MSVFTNFVSAQMINTLLNLLFNFSSKLEIHCVECGICPIAESIMTNTVIFLVSDIAIFVLKRDVKLQLTN